MWTQWDQFCNHQIPLHDENIIAQQNKQRIANHTPGPHPQLEGKGPHLEVPRN